MTLADQVKQAGWSAPRRGIPTHVKLAAQADLVIANGAECEPLLYKDAASWRRKPPRWFAACSSAWPRWRERRSHRRQSQEKEAVKAVQAACQGTSVRVQLLGDYYPSGDEYDLVYSVSAADPALGIPSTSAWSSTMSRRWSTSRPRRRPARHA